MNVHGLRRFLVCLSLLPFSCRDFDDQKPSGAAGEGGENAGGSSDGGRAVGGDVASSAGDGALPSSGQGGLEGGAGVASNEDVSGASGTAAGAEGLDHGGTSEGGGGGEGGSPDAGSLSPAEVTGVVLWLSASSQTCVRGADQRLSVWLDGSGNGNDAKPDPSMTPPKFGNGTLDGHNVVRFTPADSADSSYMPERLQIADSESLHLADGDFSILIVGRYGNAEQSVVYNQATIYNGAGAFFGKQERTYPFRGVLLMTNYPGSISWAPAQTRLAVQLELGGALAMSYSDHLNQGGLRLYEVRRRGDDLALFINGEREGGTRVATGTDLSAVGYPIVLGGEPIQPLSGDISEIVMLKGSVSDTDQHSLERYLMRTYGLL